MGKAGQGYKLLRSCALRLLALAAAAAIPSGASSAEAVDGILISSPSLAVSGEYRRKYTSDLFSSAFRGDADSMYRLGIMYRDGAGLPRNSENAIELLRRSADKGNDSAASALALLYLDRSGSAPDYDAAVSVLKSAAGRGSSDAQYILWTLYKQGLAVKKDQAVALQYLRQAAADHNPQAEFDLAYCYETGFCGVNGDLITARRLYRNAADAGIAGAAYRVSLMMENGEGGKIGRAHV